MLAPMHLHDPFVAHLFVYAPFFGAALGVLAAGAAGCVVAGAGFLTGAALGFAATAVSLGAWMAGLRVLMGPSFTDGTVVTLSFLLLPYGAGALGMVAAALLGRWRGTGLVGGAVLGLVAVLTTLVVTLALPNLVMLA